MIKFKPIQKPVENNTNIFSKLFSATAQIHIFHLQVNYSSSYAAHMALNGLYDSIPGKLDSLIETIQGKTEQIIKDYTLIQPENFVNIEQVLNYLRSLKNDLETYRVNLPTSWANIDNQIQTIIDDFESCIYKLKFLL